MAVNALGLPLLFQASPQQLDGLLAGLQPGSTLRGRIVEVVGQDQAIVNLQGQNVVAQLPAGTVAQKGDSLLLQVTQVATAQAGKAASLTLRLLPPPAEAPLPGAESARMVGTLVSQGSLEQALGAARLPVNTISMSVAETLSRLGVPLTPTDLQTAVQATVALLANEQAPTSATGGSLPPTVQAALQQSLAQVRMAAQLNPAGEPSLILQQAASSIEAVLQGVPGTVASAAGVPVPAPGPGFAQSAPAASPVNSGTAVPSANSVAASALSLENAVANFVVQPSATSLAEVQAAVAQLATAAALASAAVPSVWANPSPPAASTPASPVLPAVAPPMAPAPATSLPSSTAVLATPALVSAPTPSLTTTVPAAGTGPTPPPVSAPAPGPVTLAPAALATPDFTALPAQREALAQLLGSLRSTAGPFIPADLAQAATALAQHLTDPASLPSQRLVAAVQAQAPGATAEAVLADARQALATAAGILSGQPTGEPLPTLSAVRSALQVAGAPAPQSQLTNLPVEVVAEAVAWLQARGLPPQRPLVETVATWISQGQDALAPTARALQGAGGLPEGMLDATPSLKMAVQNAQTALASSGLLPETQGLSDRLQNWADAQGLTLEAQWAKPPSAAPASVQHGAAAAVAAPTDGLKPALLRLESELKAALRSPSNQDPGSTQKLESTLKDVQSAVQAFNAVPLQAQGAPAFDTVHLPLPVWMNGQLGEGRLSITWRQGRERDLDEKDPVSVAVALKTGSLGEVKVLLQVWKGQASARVVGESPEVAAFLEGGAEDLKQGFAERTPFKLLGLEFSAQDARTSPTALAPEPTGLGGLSLRA